MLAILKIMKRLSMVLFSLLVIAAFGVLIYFAAPSIFGSVVVPLPDEYKGIVAKYADQYKVPRCLIAGIIRGESNWNPGARSRVGAGGMMQIMPGTFSSIVRLEGLPYGPNQRFDPEPNIHVGVALTAYNLRNYGSVRNALVAYNAGGGRVRLPDSQLPRETRGYIERIPQYVALYESNYPDFCGGGAVKYVPASSGSRGSSGGSSTPAPERFNEFTGVPQDETPEVDAGILDKLNKFWTTSF